MFDNARKYAVENALPSYRDFFDHYKNGMWGDTLDAQGVVDLKSPTPLAPNRVLTREEAAQKNADMKITQGEAYRLQFQIFKYNYEKNEREPMNLTGYQARFRIYSPPKEVEIEISIPELGIEFDYKVPLSKEQGMQYVTLKSDDERSLFTKAVIDSDKKLKDNLQQEITNKVRTKNDTQQNHRADRD